MALHLYGRHKCRMCGARLVPAETVERPRVERGGNILYKGVRRLACPNGCPISLYDFSKATAIGPAPVRKAPNLPPEPPKAEGDETPKKPRKEKAVAKEGADSVADQKDVQPEAKDAADGGGEEANATNDEAAKAAEAEGAAPGAQKDVKADLEVAAEPGQEDNAADKSGGAEPAADGEAETKSAPAAAAEAATKQDAPAKRDAPAKPETPAQDDGAAAVAAPKRTGLAVLGRIYMIVGFAFAYFLFIMTITVADVPPTVKLSYYMAVAGVALLNAFAFFMPNRSRDEQEG